MEAKELRLGNYVYNGGIISLDIEMLYAFNECLYDLQPIPITEQWLLDLGFKAKKAYNRTFYYADSFNEWKVIYQDGLIKRNGKVIKHIHQLQNLYFALTGQELKLKSNE